jgi:Ni/Co efflux regulator RcnB
MKNKILISALIIVSVTPIAAEARPNELRHDRTDVREERRDVQRAVRSRKPGVIRDEREDLREAHQEYREDLRERSYNDRGHYRGNRFVAPFRYNRFNTGVRISYGYYQPRYYVNNYSSYRLRAPGYHLRYVRHYNDLLLVNVQSGQIVRVYRSFYY